MPYMRMKKDGAGIGDGAGATTNAALTVVGSGNSTELLSAAVMVLLDEINALRTLGLIGLAAKTPEQIAAAIEAKRTG